MYSLASFEFSGQSAFKICLSKGDVMQWTKISANEINKAQVLPVISFDKKCQHSTKGIVKIECFFRPWSNLT